MIKMVIENYFPEVRNLEFKYNVKGEIIKIYNK